VASEGQPIDSGSVRGGLPWQLRDVHGPQLGRVSPLGGRVGHRGQLSRQLNKLSILLILMFVLFAMQYACLYIKQK